VVVVHLAGVVAVELVALELHHHFQLVLPLQ
jgi:hypothetical protein